LRGLNKTALLRLIGAALTRGFIMGKIVAWKATLGRSYSPLHPECQDEVNGHRKN